MKIRKIRFRKMNRKAQIASTLTWFVGFLVIFFVMGLFLTATILFSAKKKIISGSDEIDLEKHLSDAKEQRVLFSVLNSNINFSDDKIKIKDVLKNTDMYNLDAVKKQELKEKIENKTKEILINEFGEVVCYVFEAKYDLDKSIFRIDNLNEFYNPESSKAKLSENSVPIVLILNQEINTGGINNYNKMVINFYGGKCL